ncbi:hypothetical protein P22_1102 [Propionispora sp. 2/2-37]|uniref:Cof-type HAD-IIB family hydrolase n=1 Tax=Propionispora sp. 2/2-37 TaxID=1677858 RepID=UPI0006BB8AB6|nr:Cof-type HAD-IIB family hydrolase [Propionispora sp. 2/2-37]CUH95033.1 hypothetical protein P22_1102 [Propionispora sp. 2/2-37]
MEIKWCVCDVDGTLIDSQRRLTKKTIQAIEDMRQAGIDLILSTGRSPLFIRELTASLKIKGPVICCNGGMIQHAGSGKTLFSKTIHKELIHALAKGFLANQIDALMYSHDHIYYNYGSRRAQLYHDFNEQALPEFRVPLTEIRKAEELPDTIMKFFVWDVDQAAVKNLEKTYSREGQLYLVSSMRGSVDIMSNGVSKGEALRFLAETQGIDLTKTAVFGDNYNDVSMFQFAALPIAMENGEEVAKQAAKYVTLSNDEDGVAYGIRRYILK